MRLDRLIFPALLLAAWPAAGQVTNPFPMRSTVLMLPASWDGSALEAMYFIPHPRDGVLYLWPRAADTGGSVVGGTNVAGITNLNGLTNASQTFAPGMAGSDFAISSAGSTHTFNLPTASGSARGALSSADWTTFGSKQAGNANLTAWSGLETNKVVMTNDAWLIARASNGVVVAAGAGIGVVSSGAAGQQTFTVSSTGGGGGGGWSAYDAPATNSTFWSSDTNHTNVVVQQRAGQAVPLLVLRGSNDAPIVQWDNRGFQIWTNSLTNYSLGATRGAPVGNIVMGASEAGIPVPAWTDEYKRQWELGPASWNTEEYYIAPGSGTAVFNHGGTSANAGGTVISHEVPTENKPYMVKVASAATSNSVGGISHNINLWNAGAHNGSSRVGGSFFFTRFLITNNLAGIVGGGAPRFFVGLAGAASPNLTNIVNTTNATGQYLGLMGDMHESLQLFLTCRDASAEFRTNTGINFVATNLYELSLDQPHTNRFVRWSLRDLTARLEASGVFSNNVPTNFMKMTILCKNGTNRANEIYFSKLWLNAAQSPRWN